MTEDQKQMNTAEALIIAVARLEDILQDDDGQAWKEAAKALSQLQQTVANAELEAIHAKLWRHAVSKGVITVHSEQMDDRNPGTKCSWIQGHDKAADVSNDAAIRAMEQ